MADETISVNIKHSTEKAWGLAQEGNPRGITWLPKSLVSNIEFKVTGADSGPAELTAPEWLLQREGLI